jgi:nucleoid-associated protein YgaU
LHDLRPRFQNLLRWGTLSAFHIGEQGAEMTLWQRGNKMAVQSALVGRVVLLLSAGAVVAFAGYRTFLAKPEVQEVPPTPELATVADPAEITANVPEATPATPEVALATPEPEPEPIAPPPAPPSFDVVRIEPDGSALIAGKAPPDAQVSLNLDGVQETRVQADSAGNFVAQLTFAPNPAPRMLSLLATLDDGSTLAGNETVAVAPIVAVVPEAAPEEAPKPPATLLVTEEGAQVLGAPEPVVAGEPVEVVLDAISYAPDGAVRLAGRGQAGASLRVYLDNAAVMDTAVPEDGAWAVTLPETAPGIYTLRLDQLGEDGAVTSRFETPFKRETLEALALATGVTPPAEPEPAPEPAPLPEPIPEPTPAPEQALEPEPAPQTTPEPEPAPAPIEPALAPESPVVEAAPEPILPPAPEPEPVLEPEPNVVAATAPPPPVTITVQPGFTLWGIANEMMGEGTMYVQVFEANKDKIVDPDLIYPGQVFTLPQE